MKKDWLYRWCERKGMAAEWISGFICGINVGFLLLITILIIAKEIML